MNVNKYDSKFWNDKYLNKEDTWDTGNVTPAFIVSEKKFKRNSKILIPGCGRGYDAIFLSKKKHKVCALDFSEYALQYLSNISENKKISINFLKNDFFQLSKTFYNKYDYILEYTFFCAISPKLREAYVKQCAKLLKKNGKLIGIFLPLNKDSNNNGPPFQVSIEQIKTIFSFKFDVVEVDENIQSIPQRKGNEVYIEMIKK